MIDKFHTSKRTHFLIALLLLLFSQAQASEKTCFSSVQGYLLSVYGDGYSNDENLTTSKKNFGNQVFSVVEDLTSGTNHSFALIKEYPKQVCVLLVTGPVVSLVASSYDKSGFPVSLTSVDQASPGEPSHEISYAFDPRQQKYIVSTCREIRYHGNRSYATQTDCSKILEN
jgi:hypothetical protein